MMSSDGKKTSKVAIFLIGSVVLIIGITLILLWWQDVVSLFRAAAGILLALGGLFLLYLVKE